MGLFIAIEFTDEVKNGICETIAKLQVQSLKGTYSSRVNLHSTLTMLADNDDIETIKAAMDEVTAQSFEMEVGGLGGYGIEKKRTGVVHWVQVKVNENITKLHAELIEKLKAHGLKPDDSDFKPHITIARDVELIRTFNPATFARAVPKATQLVNEITLIQSEHKDGKLTYTPIYAKKLG